MAFETNFYVRFSIQRWSCRLQDQARAFRARHKRAHAISREDFYHKKTSKYFSRRVTGRHGHAKKGLLHQATIKTPWDGNQPISEELDDFTSLFPLLRQQPFIFYLLF
jgi:hypothetical protein